MTHWGYDKYLGDANLKIYEPNFETIWRHLQPFLAVTSDKTPKNRLALSPKMLCVKGEVEQIISIFKVIEHYKIMPNILLILYTTL